DGAPRKVSVLMTHRREVTDLTSEVDPRQNLIPGLGILGVDLNPGIAEMLPVVRVRAGVVVVSTVADALDTRDGALAMGDVIYGVNQTTVSTLGELRSALDRLKPGDPAVLRLERRGELTLLAFIVD